MFNTITTARNDAPHARALACDESHATLYCDGRPVGSLERPRLYFDAPARDAARGLFRLYLDARLVATFAHAPTLRGVRRALALVDFFTRDLAALNAEELEETRLIALANARLNRDAAKACKIDTFRASSLNRALQYERRAERAAGALAAIAAATAEEAAPVSGKADDSASLAAVIVRASTVALESVADALARRLLDAMAPGERASVHNRLNLVALALNARATPPVGCELAAVRPARYDAPASASVARASHAIARHGVAALVAMGPAFGPRARRLESVQ